MSMNVEEVLKAEIPEGKYAPVLRHLQEIANNMSDELNGFRPDEPESLCASFEALLVLSGKNGPAYAIFTETEVDEAKQEGRASTLSEVRRIVEAYEEYIKLLGEELDELVSMATAHGWKSSRYDKGVVCRENIKHLLSELEAKG